VRPARWSINRTPHAIRPASTGGFSSTQDRHHTLEQSGLCTGFPYRRSRAPVSQRLGIPRSDTASQADSARQPRAGEERRANVAGPGCETQSVLEVREHAISRRSSPACGSRCPTIAQELEQWNRHVSTSGVSSKRPERSERAPAARFWLCRRLSRSGLHFHGSMDEKWHVPCELRAPGI
jgi:hypothetical protein